MSYVTASGIYFWSFGLFDFGTFVLSDFVTFALLDFWTSYWNHVESQGPTIESEPFHWNWDLGFRPVALAIIAKKNPEQGEDQKCNRVAQFQLSWEMFHLLELSVSI